MKVTRFVALSLIVVLIYPASLSLASPIEERKFQLSQVKRAMDDLNLKLERAVEDFNQSESELGAVKKKLGQNQLKLEDAKIELNLKITNLSNRIKEAYKKGPFYSIYLIIRSKSLRELVENIYYLSLVIKSDNLLVSKLRISKQKFEDISKKLLAQKASKEILVNKVAAKKFEVENALSAKKRLLSSIKVDLARLQAEERERIKRIREEALRKLAANQPTARNYNGANNSGSQVVEIAKKYLGVPYRWGGTSPETGFDCSGFVWYVYSQVGVYLPRTSREQYNFLASKGQLVNEGNLHPGDLVFYGHGYVSDVKLYMGSGYVIGANGGQFIPGEVKILPLHYRSDYYAAGRP